MRFSVPLVGFVVLVALAQAGASADLRNNLVPMTSSNNAGPKYDIEFNTPELSPSTLSSTSDNSEKKSQAEREANSEANNGANDEEIQPIGTVHVRRIYIVPSMGPSSWFSNPFSMMSPAQSMDNPTVSIDRRPSTSLFERDTPSLWSLLGGGGSGLMDESPSMDNGDVETNVERRKETQDTQASETKPSSFANDVDRRPTSMSPDPRDLLMDMLQQMLQTRLTAFRNHFDDMMPSASSETNNNNDTSNNKNSNNNDNASLKPGTHNETKEDIVEYDGIKYLRKTIITKNIGQNHMFYTKRYILRPLNETTTSTTSGTNESTTTASTSTTSFTRGESMTTSTTPQPPMTSAATEVTSESSTERPSSASSPVTESINPKKEADFNREQLEKEDTLVTPLSTPMIEGTDNARLVRKKGAPHVEIVPRLS